jgi:hypothetical protein
LKRTAEYKRADAAYERAGESGLAEVDGEGILVWSLAGDLETDVLGEREFPQTIKFLRAASRHTAASAKAEALKDSAGRPASTRLVPTIDGLRSERERIAESVRAAEAALVFDLAEAHPDDVADLHGALHVARAELARIDERLSRAEG